MQIKIDSNIPIPDKTNGKTHGQYKSYPFEQMKVGDSIFIEGDEKSTEKARCAALMWGARHNGEKFKSRMVEGGRRIWRIA